VREELCVVVLNTKPENFDERRIKTFLRGFVKSERGKSLVPIDGEENCAADG
jgi:hypothetical protein